MPMTAAEFEAMAERALFLLAGKMREDLASPFFCERPSVLQSAASASSIALAAGSLLAAAISFSLRMCCFVRHADTGTSHHDLIRPQQVGESRTSSQLPEVAVVNVKEGVESAVESTEMCRRSLK